MPETITPAEPLRSEIAGHHRRFSPIYQGYLSDHGPMAALAFLGLGADEAGVSRWLTGYQQKLAPLATAPVEYRKQLDQTLTEMAVVGPEVLLHQRLPGLISGWTRNAYHPLIRIAYGYQFDLPEEIAAGLAYLTWCGPDEVFTKLARRAQPADDPMAPFRAMAACRTAVSAGRRFDDCVDWVRAQPAFQSVPVLVPEPLVTCSRLALEIFAATHDFFALHLVTGSHAFRILYPFAGPHRDAVLVLGLLAGYASVGAPAFSKPTGPLAGPPAEDWLALIGDASADEHAIKLAYSAASQAEFFADPRYAGVAARYLTTG